MTPKEKAKELVNKFEEKRLSNFKHLFPEWSKECAIITVNELINSFEYLKFEFGEESYTTHSFWQEVKQEIKKL